MTKRRHGPKPHAHGTCACGAPCVDYAAEFQMRPGAHYNPESATGDIPDRYYGDAVWTPVCYEMTPARHSSRAYRVHVLRLAEHGDPRTGEAPDPAAAAAIRRMIDSGRTANGMRITP